MATQRIDLLSRLDQDPSGNVYWKPSSIDDANDRFPHRVLAFKDTGTKISISGQFTVPKNWTSTNGSKIIIRWKTTATTGDVVWDVEYKAVAAGESLDPSTDDEALTVTDTAAGTARLANDCEVALTEANLAVDDTVLFTIARDGASGSDTLAAEAHIEEIWLEYLDA